MTEALETHRQGNKAVLIHQMDTSYEQNPRENCSNASVMIPTVDGDRLFDYKATTDIPDDALAVFALRSASWDRVWIAEQLKKTHDPEDEEEDGTINPDYEYWDKDDEEIEGAEGFIYITKESAKGIRTDEELKGDLRKICEQEIEEYNAWCEGEMYGWQIVEYKKCDLEHKHEEELESCWSYYDLEYCRKSALEEAKAYGITKPIED